MLTTNLPQPQLRRDHYPVRRVPRCLVALGVRGQVRRCISCVICEVEVEARLRGMFALSAVLNGIGLLVSWEMGM